MLLISNNNIVIIQRTSGTVIVSPLKRKKTSYLNQVSGYNDRGTIAIRDTASKGQTTVANRDTGSQYKALP